MGVPRWMVYWLENPNPIIPDFPMGLRDALAQVTALVTIAQLAGLCNPCDQCDPRGLI